MKTVYAWDQPKQDISLMPTKKIKKNCCCCCFKCAAHLALAHRLLQHHTHSWHLHFAYSPIYCIQKYALNNYDL